MPIQKLQEAYFNASQYEVAGVTGATAAGAGTNIIFYARWTSTTQQALIERVKITGHVASTAFAVGTVAYQLNIARAFTSESGSSHTTSILPANTANKLLSSFPPTAFTAIKVCDTTAGGTGTPTWTLDANPVGYINTHTSAGVGAATPIIGSQFIPGDGILFNANIAAGECPIVLNANDGIAIRVTVPATGVSFHGVQMKWAETDRIIL